jgi:probable phosphoglycerate mutase
MLLSWFDPAVPEAALPGGETKAGFLARYDGAIGRITADLAENGGGTAVAVSHGGAIPAWVFSRAVTPGLKFDLSRPLSNTGVVMLAGGPSDGWTLQSWEGEDV